MSASVTSTEIASQPDCWLRAVETAGAVRARLPERGERVAVIGCGTSWFMAQSYAALREQAGHGVTDAFAASAFPFSRAYDRVLAVTRSGTTTEVLRASARLREAGSRVVAVTADPRTPVRDAADDLVVLDFADERSVVQTRFATAALALLRTHLGHDLTRAVVDARTAIAEELPAALPAAEQTTFLGTGWTYGLAQEAALKMREAAGAWTESYPAMEYRHGPISIAGPDRAVWAFGGLPEGLAEAVTATGATLESRSDLDPLADLVRAQRLAVAVAERRGLDPDRPRHLTRSVVLG